MSEKMQHVRGEIVMPPNESLSGDANVIVVVEDVSRADAPALVVGEQRQSLRQGTLESLPFEVAIPDGALNPQHHYSVRVHIDTTRSGDVTKGDLVSTQSYPVLTRGHGNVARVSVRRV